MYWHLHITQLISHINWENIFTYNVMWGLKSERHDSHLINKLATYTHIWLWQAYRRKYTSAWISPDVTCIVTKKCRPANGREVTSLIHFISYLKHPSGLVPAAEVGYSYQIERLKNRAHGGEGMGERERIRKRWGTGSRWGRESTRDLVRDSGGNVQRGREKGT